MYSVRKNHDRNTEKKNCGYDRILLDGFLRGET